MKSINTIYCIYRNSVRRIVAAAFILLLQTTLCAGYALAQDFVLTGRVLDDQGNPVELCTVSCIKQAKATMTNLKGEFSLSLSSADSVEVRFSMIGYKAKTRTLRRPRGRQNLQITLYEDNQELQGVTVTEKKRQTSTTQELDVKDMKQAPSATGNAVEELIQQQAGVSTHSELSSQYNVRGGSFDENSVYINNVEVYRPFLVRSGQQEGLSIINPDMVEKIAFSTGGYEAKYGDKMSSALDITYHRPKRTEMSLSASLMGASAYLGFGGKKFSWSNGFRYKQTKALLKTFDTTGEYDPSFIDYQTYMTFTPNKRWQVEFIGDISQSRYNFYPKDRETTFGTQDNLKAFKVYFDGQEKDLFRTYFGTLTLRRIISDKATVSLIGSAFHTKEQETYDIQGQYWLTQTETQDNMGVGTYMEYARNYLTANVASLKLMLDRKTRRHAVQAAVQMRWEHITENSREYEMRDSSGYVMPHTGSDLYMIYTMAARNSLRARRIEAYVQDTWKFASPLESNFYTLNYGVRFSNWSFNHESIVSPRASLSVVPYWNENVTLRFAAGLYYQAPFFKELRDTTTIGGVTYATLNRKIKSQQSVHFIAAMDYRFKSDGRPFKFTAEAYYKLLSDLIPYSVNNVKVTYNGLNEATGHIAGIDFKLYGEFVPGTDSWITFSLMSTGMKYRGESIPLPTDQRYAVNLFFTDYFPGTDRWRMTLKLAYADGLPFGPPHSDNARQHFRAPAYQRVDIGMSYRAYKHEAQQNNKFHLRNMWLALDCLNLLGHNNVNSYYWVTDVTNHQYAVPNYLTGRQLNARLTMEF
ncbi:MAG: carboxypeptidase-like regulatory domain-containing protein [Prevotella sp.]|nr:carboxypeptidase-like regulatory domain-containing protein [Prevotella sp.]